MCLPRCCQEYSSLNSHSGNLAWRTVVRIQDMVLQNLKRYLFQLQDILIQQTHQAHTDIKTLCCPLLSSSTRESAEALSVGFCLLFSRNTWTGSSLDTTKVDSQPGLLSPPWIQESIYFFSSKSIKNGEDKVVRVVRRQMWDQKAWRQWYGAVCSEICNLEFMATLSTHPVHPGWGGINTQCLPTANNAAGEKQITHHCKNAIDIWSISKFYS